MEVNKYTVAIFFVQKYPSATHELKHITSVTLVCSTNLFKIMLKYYTTHRISVIPNLIYLVSSVLRKTYLVHFCQVWIHSN